MCGPCRGVDNETSSHGAALTRVHIGLSTAVTRFEKEEKKNCGIAMAALLSVNICVVLTKVAV